MAQFFRNLGRIQSWVELRIANIRDISLLELVFGGSSRLFQQPSSITLFTPIKTRLGLFRMILQRLEREYFQENGILRLILDHFSRQKLNLCEIVLTSLTREVISVCVVLQTVNLSSCPSSSSKYVSLFF